MNSFVKIIFFSVVYTSACFAGTRYNLTINDTSYEPDVSSACDNAARKADEKAFQLCKSKGFFLPKNAFITHCESEVLEYNRIPYNLTLDYYFECMTVEEALGPQK